MIFQVVDIKIGTLGTKSLDVLWLLSLHGESSRLKIYGAWIVTTRSHQLPFVVACRSLWQMIEHAGDFMLSV